MESLHAPWRIKYILGPKNTSGEASVFSQIAQSCEDEENYVISRSRHSFALLNKYPYTGGHALIAPYKQAQDLDDLTGTRELGEPSPALGWCIFLLF